MVYSKWAGGRAAKRRGDSASTELCLKSFDVAEKPLEFSIIAARAVLGMARCFAIILARGRRREQG
jgi:hypothetical protein